jgi:uncharacterized protein (TIGR03435 family)
MKAFPISHSFRLVNCACAATGILIWLAFLSAAFSEGPAFEVASIRPVVAGGWMRSCSGGPGTNNPGRFTCENVNLPELLRIAFGVKIYQVQVPSSVKDEQFYIAAKIPAGATKEQVRQMVQNLLIERFGLKFRRENKEMEGFELVVAKNGPKFKESDPERCKEPTANPQTAKTDQGPFDIPPCKSRVIITKDYARGQWIQTTMGSVGKYDISLEWAPEIRDLLAADALPAVSEPFAPNIFTALQEQLGLKLQRRKVMIENIVVDHIEKTPTEN